MPGEEPSCQIAAPLPALPGSDSTSIQERADALFRNAEILAPMVRASTTPLRTLALSYGADLVYTEEIVDRSITTCDRVINEKLGTIDYVRKTDGMSAKTLKRLKAKNEIPVVLRIAPELERGRLIYQIGTGESNLALPAALAVQQDVDGLDINMVRSALAYYHLSRVYDVQYCGSYAQIIPSHSYPLHYRVVPRSSAYRAVWEALCSRTCRARAT